MAVPAIILAAGASRRLGHPKQLLQVDGETLLARTIHAARHAGADPVLVILGAFAPEISASVPLNDVVTVLNPDWQEGIASSVRAGIRSLLSCVPDATATVLLVCDQPRLDPAHIRALIESFHRSPSATAIASTYSGVRGIPAVFPQSLFPSLLDLSGDKGARSILADPRCPIVEVPFAGGEIDIDSPADLDRLKETRPHRRERSGQLTAGSPNPDFLRRAIALATQNVVANRGGPFGAVIVKDGRIVGEAANAVTATNDPTAHAEVNAIRAACNALNTFSLRGCQLYTSCEPCPMCLSAAYWARIDAIYFGCSAADAARAGFDDAFLYEELRKQVGERAIPASQLLREEALASMNAWIASSAKIPF